MVTHVSVMPALKVGVLVFTNQREGLALSAISLPVLESYANAKPPAPPRVVAAACELAGCGD